MSKNNNQFLVDYAYPGLCSLCHTEVAEFMGSKNGVAVISRIKGNFRQAEVKLNDGSYMRVSLCEDCYKDFSPEKMGELMESEIAGWVHESRRTNNDPDVHAKVLKEARKKFVKDRSDKKWNDEDRAKIKKPKIKEI